MNFEKNEIDALVVQETWRAVDAVHQNFPKRKNDGVREDIFALVCAKIASVFTSDIDLGLEARQKIVQGVIERTPFSKEFSQHMREYFLEKHIKNASENMKLLFANSEKTDLWFKKCDDTFLKDNEFYFDTWMSEFPKYTALLTLRKLVGSDGRTYEKIKSPSHERKIQAIIKSVAANKSLHYVKLIEDSFKILAGESFYKPMIEAIYDKDYKFFDADFNAEDDLYEDYEEYQLCCTNPYKTVNLLFFYTLSQATQNELVALQSEALDLWRAFDRDKHTIHNWATQIETSCLNLMQHMVAPLSKDIELL